MGQVYIEDYVVSFLKQKKTEAKDIPTKLALFGTVTQPKTLFNKDNNKGSGIARYIYGAAVLEDGRPVEDIGDEYFKAYQFLGYVNVHNSGGENTSQYHVFYDENIAMQEYLLYHYMSPYSAFRRHNTLIGEEFQSPFCIIPETKPNTEKSISEPDKSLKIVKSKKSQKKSLGKVLLAGKTKMFTLILLCLIVAAGINTINDYPKMHDFAQITGLAISFTK